MAYGYYFFTRMSFILSLQISLFFYIQLDSARVVRVKGPDVLFATLFPVKLEHNNSS